MTTITALRKIEFGDFLLSMADGEGLTLNGEPINLAPKELNVLKMLVSRPGALITKDEILNCVWKGQDISEESLTRCIYILRKTLEVGINKECIKTVYGKGYQFILSVKEIFYDEDKNRYVIDKIDIIRPIGNYTNDLSSGRHFFFGSCVFND